MSACIYRASMRCNRIRVNKHVPPTAVAKDPLRPEPTGGSQNTAVPRHFRHSRRGTSKPIRRPRATSSLRSTLTPTARTPNFFLSSLLLSSLVFSQTQLERAGVLFSPPPFFGSPVTPPRLRAPPVASSWARRSVFSGLSLLSSRAQTVSLLPQLPRDQHFYVPIDPLFFLLPLHRRRRR